MKVHLRGAVVPSVGTPTVTATTPPGDTTAPGRGAGAGPQLTPPEGQPVVGPAALGWSTSDSWLDHTMLKPPFQSNLPLDDLSTGPPAIGVELPELSPTDDRRAVYEKLKDVPLGRLLVAPGYRYYRRPEQFAAVLEQVKTGHRVDTRPSIMNVHTDGHGHVVNVDLHSHHLRLAAFLENGAKKLGDLPFDQVLLKVDGQQREDHVWPMKAHGYALPPEVLATAGLHRLDANEPEPATVALDNPPNWDLGSRTSLAQFHETLVHRVQPKIGVVYGSGPELVARALALKARSGLDEVVIAADSPTDEGLRAQVLGAPGVNLYLDEPGSLRAAFPDLDYQQLVKYRLNLIYGVSIDAIVS